MSKVIKEIKDIKFKDVFNWDDLKYILSKMIEHCKLINLIYKRRDKR